MSLALLFNAPVDDASLLSFLNANYDEHVQDINRLNMQQGVLLPLLDIRLMDPSEPGIWALQHQAMHDALNAELGIVGADLTKIDPRDREAMQGLILLHAHEHLSYRQALNF